MPENTYKAKFAEIRDQIGANLGVETRATSAQHRILQMYRDAIRAKDWTAVEQITAEWGRQQVALGQAIAGERTAAA